MMNIIIILKNKKKMNSSEETYEYDLQQLSKEQQQQQQYDDFFYFIVLHIIMNSISIIFGVFGSLLIKGTILYCKELHNSSINIIIFNLSLANLISYSFIYPFRSITLIFGSNILTTNNLILCNIIGSLSIIISIIELLLILLLALNRYIKIFYNYKYDSIFSNKNTFIYCLFAWLFIFLIINIIIPPLNNNNNNYYFYNTGNQICQLNILKSSSSSYVTFIIIILLIIIIVTILYLYIKIIKKLDVIRKKSLSYGLNNYNDMTITIQITKGLIASFLIYLFTYMPYTLIYFIDYKNQLPNEVHIFMILMSHFNSIFNPFIYSITNLLNQNNYKLFIYFILLKNRQNRAFSISS
jgi:hypothetical protein